MNQLFLEIYNNLIKLTRNKNLYNTNKDDTFYDRMVILFFHLGFLLKEFKNIETKKNMQNFFDYSIKQVELSIREIGYGDATINKKMKDYVNLLFSIIDKIEKWESYDTEQKKEIFGNYIEENNNYDKYVSYFDKYRLFLSKNTFNNLAKDILTQ